MDRITLRCLPLVLFLLVSQAASFTQNPATNKATATVSGRITIGNQPAVGAEVLLKKRSEQVVDAGGMQPPAVAVTTDADGQYRIANLAAGSYRISVYAPAYVVEGESRWSYEYGKTVNVAEGENVENVDFSLTRGGVITGRITDEYGRPVIAEGVEAFRLDEKGKRDNSASSGIAPWQTDDRGIYRIYGLAPGHYIVGAGVSSDDAMRSVGSRGKHKRTYHPDAVNESKAILIEVKPGSEVENVDIRLARPTKGFTASGRVTDAETGQPLPGVMIGYGVVKETGFNYGTSNTTTNSKGEFRIEGLSPNTYNAYVLNPGQSNLYAEQINFEIIDSDATGLEIKMIRGGIISGVAVIEGVRDPSVLRQVSKIPLRAEGVMQDVRMIVMMMMTGGGTGSINSDGTFRISGVRPGKVRIVAPISVEPKGFTLARVEYNGVEVKEFDIAQGEQITGVRLIFTYGTSILAGHVEIKGGALPPSARMSISAIREGVSPEWLGAKRASVDARGQFVLEGLSQGNYKVRLDIYTPDAASQLNLPKVELPVAVMDNTRQEVTLVLDLSKRENDK